LRAPACVECAGYIGKACGDRALHRNKLLEYRCPAGKVLRSERRRFKNSRTHVTKAETIIYRSSQPDCAGCSMKDRCCPNTPFRKITRSVYEAAREEAKRIGTTPPYKQSRRERKKVEMLLAHLKRILKLAT
jgi:hypothetical protein